MSNPYESPQFTSAVAVPQEDRDKLRRVARYQQWVLYALLANIVINVLVMANAMAGYSAILATIGTLVGLLVVVAGMVAIYLLAKEIYNVGIGVLCAVLMLLPCISLIALLIVNGKATTYLQQRGVKVGLMGANPDTI
jgi:hypothetical protein